MRRELIDLAAVRTSFAGKEHCYFQRAIQCNLRVVVSGQNASSSGPNALSWMMLDGLREPDSLVLLCLQQTTMVM